MSVIIKHMDLPKSCDECPFMVTSDSSDGIYDICMAMSYKKYRDDRIIESYEDEDGNLVDFDIESGRHPDCPMRQKARWNNDGSGID